MKRWFFILLILPCLTVNANEILEDYFDIAGNYCTYGKYNDAITYINKILEIEPYNSEAKELKNTLLRITNPNIKSYLTSTNQNLDKAFLYKKAGNSNGFVDTLLAQPYDYWANYFLAEYYRDENNFQSAIFYYQKAIEIKPNHSQSYLGLAKTYIANKDFQNAVNNIDKYLSYNKKSDIAYALRAEANMNLNYLLEAQNDIQKALEIEENISYMLIEAKVLYYKGDYDNARIKLNLLSRNVQTSEVYKYLGLCDYAQSDYPNAMLNLNKAIILSEEDKNLISTYNNIKMMLEKTK